MGNEKITKAFQWVRWGRGLGWKIFLGRFKITPIVPESPWGRFRQPDWHVFKDQVGTLECRSAEKYRGGGEKSRQYETPQEELSHYRGKKKGKFFDCAMERANQVGVKPFPMGFWGGGGGWGWG